MLKTAIIGISGFGREHLRLLLRGCAVGRMSTQAAVVINPAEVEEDMALLRSLGCRIYGAVDEMWAAESGNIELCMIPTSISTHYPFVAQAIRHGSHVFVEKPVCGTVQEALALAALAQARDRVVCVGFQDLYCPQVRVIKEKLLAGWIGRVTAIRGWGSWPRATHYYTRNSWAGRLRDANGWVLDSPVSNALAHFLNLMLYWGGSTPDGYARMETLEGDLYRAQAIESFDTATLRITGPACPDLFFAVSHSGETNCTPVVRIDGERGWVEWTHCGDIRYQTEEGSGFFPQMDMSLLREHMIEAVCRKIETGSAPVVTIKDAIPHVMCVNALHESSAIADIPGDFLSHRQAASQAYVHVPGLEELLERAFAGQRLLKEGLCPWPGAAGRPVRLAGYNRFNGGFRADRAAQPAAVDHAIS